jgi:hypothetical protein
MIYITLKGDALYISAPKFSLVWVKVIIYKSLYFCVIVFIICYALWVEYY